MREPYARGARPDPFTGEDPMATLEADVALADGGLAAATERMADFILATCDYERTDRLSPAHFQVFTTNPMSVAYGAAGMALFLHRVRGTLPDQVGRWMLERPVAVDAYAPSLFVGSSGVAVALAETGMRERGEEVMLETYRSPLLYAEPGMFLGAAGWGWASLYFAALTGEATYLEHAVLAGEHLLRTGEEDEDGTRFWRNPSDEGKVHYGYGYGAAGIGLFLLQLGLRTGRSDFVECAEQAVAYELVNRLETVNGTSWKRFEDDTINFPYFIHGAAGIGSVLARFGTLLGRDDYLEAAADVARGIDMKWTIFPSVTNGQAGLGEFMVDMYRATGDERYLEQAHDHARTLMWYAIETPEGLAFPGRMLLRITNDWATGSAGIGLFLHRLLEGGPRLFLDLEPAGGGA